MRDARRGGYTPAGQERRGRLRLAAAERFPRGDSVREIAADLRVAECPVRRWRRAWQADGAGALKSRGPVPRERLGPQQGARLEAELRRGPLARRFADGRYWTLNRIKTLSGKLFHAGCTAEGACKLLRRAAGHARFRSAGPSGAARRRPRCGRPGCGRR
jgi:transposase